jgi:hypothetical protein
MRWAFENYLASVYAIIQKGQPSCEKEGMSECVVPHRDFLRLVAGRLMLLAFSLGLQTRVVVLEHLIPPEFGGAVGP